jgi:hypothetical protein
VPGRNNPIATSSNVRILEDGFDERGLLAPVQVHRRPAEFPLQVVVSLDEIMIGVQRVCEHVKDIQFATFDRELDPEMRHSRLVREGGEFVSIRRAAVAFEPRRETVAYKLEIRLFDANDDVEIALRQAPVYGRRPDVPDIGARRHQIADLAPNALEQPRRVRSRGGGVRSEAEEPVAAQRSRPSGEKR